MPPAFPSPNLALEAKASASETYLDLTPEKAIDGSYASRWSGIPGHNEGVWYQLDWDHPVTVGEVIIHQYDTFVFELDVQVRAPGSDEWTTVQHFGRPGERLRKVVMCRFDPREVTGLRIGNITNGPSFTEVQAFADAGAHSAVTRVASDLRGNMIAIVSDEWGAEPIEGAFVTASGESPAGAWERHATTDAHGLAFLPLAVGFTGAVRVHTSAGELATDDTVFAGSLQYGLTPRCADAPPVSLNGEWRFTPDPPAGFEAPEYDDSAWPSITVPGHWEMHGFHPLSGIGGYRRTFRSPEGRGRVKLLFDGVYSGADVWVNGRHLAYHEGGATPFEVDVTDALRGGDNVLCLRVAEHTDTSDQLDHMSLYADFPLAGIMRKVTLFRVPDLHVGQLEVDTRFDEAFVNAALAVRLAVVNESGEGVSGGTVRFELTDPDGAPVPLESPARGLDAGPWARAEVGAKLGVRSPRKWDAEHPNLYTLTSVLERGGVVVERVSQRIGFRQVDVVGPEIHINGKRVKLRGTCHHDADPLLGRAITPELERLDMTLIKRCNLNAVRTSHYPQLPELAEAADEIGLYVEDEGSFCWVGVSDDLRLTPRIMQLVAELLARDRNHPSVFMWSICNESGFGYGFERSHEWVRKVDPSRPTGAATSAWLEIATLHNPIATSRIQENERLEQPLLFDESFAPYQGIWGDLGELWVDPGIRDYYGEPFPAIYDAFMRSRSTQGSFIWCWGDDVFLVPGRGLEFGRGATPWQFLSEIYRMPGRGITGDASWGLIDGWRREKPEYWIIKKVHSPVKVSEDPLPLTSDGQPIRVAVENQYDFTDLGELRIEWSLGEEGGVVEGLSVPPWTTGTIEISPRENPKPGDVVGLTFSTSDGTLVDRFAIPIARAAADPAPACPPETTPLRVVEESTLAGSAVRIVGANFELAFDRGSGLLRRGVAYGDAVLLEMPSLHVLESSNPLRPLPDRLRWRLSRLDVTPVSGDVRVTVEGAYDDFAGRYEITIAPTGEMSVASSFEYQGKGLTAREIGLRLSVPTDCDLLRWDRNGEWNVYPDDHIGRPKGEARALAEHPASLSPQWPWSLDNSPMGCNDFRSAKRHINWASLERPGGPSVVVVSDGTKAVRAMVETDRISLHVCDWYGGTGARMWEWVHNYGAGREIKMGDRLESRVRLRLVPGGER